MGLVMVLLDTALLSSYRLTVATILLSVTCLAAICNAIFDGRLQPANLPFPWGTAVPAKHNVNWEWTTRVSLPTASHSIQGFSWVHECNRRPGGQTYHATVMCCNRWHYHFQRFRLKKSKPFLLISHVLSAR